MEKGIKSHSALVQSVLKGIDLERASKIMMFFQGNSWRTTCFITLGRKAFV